MDTLERSIKGRHSTRKFLSTPVPRSLVNEALALAQHAPSNSNIQPWRIVFASGAARDRLKEALLDVAKQETPRIPPLPESFRHYRSQLGLQVYGVGMGIAHDDKQSKDAAVLRNFEFFGAPLVGVICMHRDLGPPDALSVGMYVQTLLLALTERGLDTCVEVSVTGYPDVLRRELNIEPELLMLSGLAIGYADPAFPANELRIQRDPVEKSVTFFDD
ncbi:nitroreductase [Lepidopterella palustris CBS 459.81]|uniref:Nitroreductase n=1 Tax=Lepidopterella palustris CBS 459.81 TaxID=1314670 RepID=A0A8E2DYA7_9PEZI|nr:nitroreductase [Lepidopterella palustris CBS 459.81]